MQLSVNPGFRLEDPAGNTKGIFLPGDKSLSHRAALFAALAKGESRIRNFLVSGVTKAMLDALSQLSITWELKNNELFIVGKGLHGFETPILPIDCGNSATTMRLLAGAIAASGIEAILTGSAGLQRRPMKRIVEPLRLMGVNIDYSESGTAPLIINKRPLDLLLTPIEYIMPVASAQVKSCLLLASLKANGTTVLYEPGPSRDHTERMLREMGVSIISKESKADGMNDQGVKFITSITPPLSKNLMPFDTTLPGDISSAAFLIVAGLIVPDSELTIKNVGLNPTRTGILDALKRMGANIQVDERSNTADREPVGDIIVRYSPLVGTEISGAMVVRMIDEFPAFAVAAAYAKGKTIVRDAEELRNKESDRIAALISELRKLGVDASETADGFIIHGEKTICGGLVQTHGDHRLAMSMAVAGLASSQAVIINDAEIINESFPEFIQILTDCGAQMKIED